MKKLLIITFLLGMAFGVILSFIVTSNITDVINLSIISGVQG